MMALSGQDSRDVAQLPLRSASCLLSKLQDGCPMERVASCVAGGVTGLALRRREAEGKRGEEKMPVCSGAEQES